MTELSFLIDLILNEKLTKRLKERISERIKVLESLKHIAHLQEEIGKSRIVVQNTPNVSIHDGQPESTRRLLEKHAVSLPAQLPVDHVTPSPSLAAQQALQHRAEVIAQAVSGKEERGRTSPRKF